MRNDLSPEVRAHELRLRLYSHPSEIETIRIPACSNRRVVTQLTVGVPRASMLKQFKMRVAKIEQHPAQ